MISKAKITNWIGGFALLFIGSITGGIIGTKYVLRHQADTDRSYNISPAHQVSTSVGPAATLDFSKAASKSTRSVVHIAATESDQLAKQRIQRQRQNDPFSMFFGDGFFGGGFERQFHRKSGSGSGVILSPDGYIVTNNHVIEFADEYEVTLTDNRMFKGVLVARDPKTDLAVIKIEGENLHPISYGDSDEVKIGEWVLAVGNPFSYLTSTVTAGIVSAKGRDLDILGEGRSTIESFIQTDAAVNPGNSGGALVDTDGNLIGINTAIATPTGTFAGYSFAIPVNLMRKIVDDLINYGSPQRGFLGIEISDMDDDLAGKFKLDVTEGVYVFDVTKGGAADFAGVLPQDVIIGANDHTIKSVPDLQEIVGSTRIGDIIDLAINRSGKLLNIPVKIKE